MTLWHYVLLTLFALSASLLVGWTVALATGDAEELADALAKVWVR